MQRALWSLVVVVVLVMAGCATRGEDPNGAAGSTTPGQGSTGAGVFPAVVEHQFGSTTIPTRPTRVVSVGLTEQDTLLQLGVVPIATTEWYGEQPYAVWPWAKDLLGDAEPTVLTTSNGMEFEKIATLQPDLIIGVNAGMTAKDYKLLSAIAPTVAGIKGSLDYFSPWRDQTLQIARALGREADGQALIDAIEQKYAAAAAAHPEWKGKTATFAQGAPYDGVLYVYQDGLNTDFLTDLGFEITAGLEKHSPQAGHQAEISAENVSLLDAHVIVFATETAKGFDELQKFGTMGNLEAVQKGRAVYTDPTVAGAIYFITPLSLEYVLAELTPRLEKAAQGTSPKSFPS